MNNILLYTLRGAKYDKIRLMIYKDYPTHFSVPYLRTLYTVHCNLPVYTVHCTVYVGQDAVHFTEYIGNDAVHCTLYTVHVLCTVYRVRRTRCGTLYSVRRTRCGTWYRVCRTRCGTLYTVHVHCTEYVGHGAVHCKPN